MTHLTQALGACCLESGIESSVESVKMSKEDCGARKNEPDSDGEVGRKDEGRRLEIKSTGQDSEFAKNFRH